MRTMKRVVVKLTSDLVEGCHEERIHKIVGPELAPKVVESGMMAMTGAADRQVLSVATSASEPSPLTRGDITFLSGGQAPRWEDRHSSDPDRAPEPLLWHEALDGGSHDTGARVFGHPLWAPASPLPAICVPTHLAGPEQCSAVLAHAYRTANQLLDAQPDLWDDAHKEAFQQLTSEELASRLTGVARLVYRPPANAERPAAVLGHVCGFREDCIRRLHRDRPHTWSEGMVHFLVVERASESCRTLLTQRARLVPHAWKSAAAVLSGALAKLNRLRTGLAPSEPAVLQARDRLLGYSLGRIDERSLVHDSGAKLKLVSLRRARPSLLGLDAVMGFVSGNPGRPRKAQLVIAQFPCGTEYFPPEWAQWLYGRLASHRSGSVAENNIATLHNSALEALLSHGRPGGTEEAPARSKGSSVVTCAQLPLRHRAARAGPESSPGLAMCVSADSAASSTVAAIELPKDAPYVPCSAADRWSLGVLVMRVASEGTFMHGAFASVRRALECRSSRSHGGCQKLWSNRLPIAPLSTKVLQAELQGRHGADMQLHVLANVSDVSASHEWDALLDLENAAPLGRAASAAGADSLAIPPASATAKRVCSSPSLSSASMVTLALPEDSDSVKTAIAALEKLRRASSTAQITVFHAKCTTAIRGLAKADLQMVAKRLAPQLRRGRRGKLESALIAHFTPVGRESPAVAAEAHPGNGKPFVTTSGRRPIADAESTTCAWLRYETHEALESVRPFLALNSCQRLKEASYCRVLGKVSSTPHFDVVVTTSDREQTSTGADQALRGIKDVLGFSGSHVHHVPDLRLGDLGGCGAAAAASHAAAARPTTVLEKPSSTFVVLAHGMEASLDEDTSESLASSRGGLCLDLDTVDDEFARQLAGTLASVPGGQSFLQAILVVACNSESTARSLSSLPCLSHVAVLGFEGKISVALSRRFLEEFFRSAKLQCVESSLLACDVERHTRSALSALNAHSMEHAGVPLLCGNFDLASSFVQARFPAGSFSGFGASVLTAVMRPRLYINGEARDIGKPYEFRTADELRELLVEAVGRSGVRANDEVCDIQAMLAAPRLGCF